jgi:putative oxidoreductase
MGRWLDRWESLTERLHGVGEWLSPLGLRLLLAWEFWESGLEKFRGENWFADIQRDFPFPFNLAPVDLSWSLATWFELVGALALLFGLGTRFFAFALLVLTMVATASVHWPMEWSSLSDLAMGYAITDKGYGNYKLPLLFAAMLLPLVFRGAGKLSLDALVAHRLDTTVSRRQADAGAWALGLVTLGLPVALLLPGLGSLLVVSGGVVFAVDRWLAGRTFA